MIQTLNCDIQDPDTQINLTKLDSWSMEKGQFLFVVNGFAAFSCSKAMQILEIVPKTLIAHAGFTCQLWGFWVPKVYSEYGLRKI